eukprot:701476-Amphidinium_carterae.1
MRSCEEVFTFDANVEATQARVSTGVMHQCDSCLEWLQQENAGEANSSSSQEPFRQRGVGHAALQVGAFNPMEHAAKVFVCAAVYAKAVSSTSRTTKSASISNAEKSHRWKPLATHFVLCVDTSGSAARRKRIESRSSSSSVFLQGLSAFSLRSFKCL